MWLRSRSWGRKRGVSREIGERDCGWGCVSEDTRREVGALGGGVSHADEVGGH